MPSLVRLSPAAWFGGRRPPTPLPSCLTLALLLHVWLVLLIGNTPGGSARPGEGVWGRLNVTLDLGGLPGDSGRSPPQPPRPEQGAVGAARRERFGGAVRSEAEAAAAPDTPGAARLGVWQAQPAELQRGPAERLAALPPAAPQALAPLASTAPLALPAPPPVLRSQLNAEPALERSAPALAADLRPPAPDATPPASLAPFAAPALPEAAPAVARELSAPAPALQRPQRDALPLAAEPTQLAGALPRFEAPRLPEPPAPVRKTTPALAPQVSRPLRDSAELAPSARTLPAESLPSFEAPALAAPAAVARRTADPGPQLERPARLAGAQAASSPALQPEAASAQRLAGLEAPQAVPATLPGVGAPDAGSRLGQDVATAPSTPASTPKLDLVWRPPRGGEIARQGSRGVLELLAHPPERKSKLSEGLENAAKKDCREAYSGAGVLAAVPLLLDAARDKGCRW